MSAQMRDDARAELIDLLLGDLEPAEDEALRARVRNEPALQRELSELEALFGLMRRGEEIEADPAVHESIMHEARRITRPSLLKRLAALPALFRFRFRHSLVFRVAAVSLGVHLIAVAVLWQIDLGGANAPENGIKLAFHPDEEVPEYRPDREFVFRLGRARVSRSLRLKQFGTEGQRADIRTGIRALMSRQQQDGSFRSLDDTGSSLDDTGSSLDDTGSSLDDTGLAALVMLSQGANSSDTTDRGAALRKTMGAIRRAVDEGLSDGFALSALIEDWALSYEQLTEEQRVTYVRAILTLLPQVSGAGAGESLVLADMAGFPVSEIQLRSLAPDGAGLMIKGDVRVAMQARADRVNASAVIARFQEEGSQALHVARSDVKAWLSPLFADAKANARAGDAAALLTLQAPYRL